MARYPRPGERSRRSPWVSVISVLALGTSVLSTGPALAAVDDRTPVTVTISSGENPSLRTEYVPFTVSLDPVPDTGVVTVFHGGNGTQSPMHPSGTTTINHRFVDAGTFTVSACFGLSQLFQDSCATVPVEQRVIAFSTRTTMSMEPTSIYRDESMTIRVGVDPAPDEPASVVVKRNGLGLPVWTIPLDPVTGLGTYVVPAADMPSRVGWGANAFVGMFGTTDHMDASSSDPVIVEGLRDSTTLSIQVETTSTPPGGRIHASATVEPAPPEGSTVEFWTIGPNGSNLYGAAPTDAAGTARGSAPTISNWPLGDYRIEARFLGDLRHGPSSDSGPFALTDTIPPSFGFIVDGPNPTTSTRDIIVRSAVSGTGSAVVIAELSHDGVAWVSMAYARELPWRLTAGDGVKTVWMRVTDAGGNVSNPGYFRITLDTSSEPPPPPPPPPDDTTRPTATAPSHRLVNGSSINGGRTAVRLAWSGSDAGSGIARYELAQSTDGGAWTSVSSTLTSPTLDRLLAPNHSYRFRLVAVDGAGNPSAPVHGPTFRLTHYGESSASVRYTGSWSNVTGAAYWGGKARASSRAGAKASLTFTGRSVEVVSRTGPTRGKAQIYINGVLKATVDLYAATYQNQRVVYTGSWSSSASRTITIKVLGTAGRPRVDLDAFVVGS